MRFFAVLVVVIGTSLSLVLPASAQQSSPITPGQVIATKTIDRFYDPIEVRAELFPRMHNRKTDQLGLLACQNGKLEIIPYQFDEWTSEGEMVLKWGEENNADQANYVLDPQDMLVFMARYLGDRVEPSMWQKLSPEGVEIEVVDPLTQDRGWVYLLYFNDKIPPSKIKSTVRIDTDSPEFQAYGGSFNMTTTSRELNGKFYKTVVNKRISIKPEAGGNGLNFIDRSKYRVSFSLLFGLIKFNCISIRIQIHCCPRYILPYIIGFHS